MANVYIVMKIEWGWESEDFEIAAVFSSLNLARKYVKSEIAPYEDRESYDVLTYEDNTTISAGKRSIGGVNSWNLRYEIKRMPVRDMLIVKLS